jgi:hypothetical protein
MDPAFISVAEALADMLDIPGQIVDPTGSVRSHITQVDIEMPIELDVTRDDDGALVLGSVPPLYAVSTSFLPSFHRLRVTAVVSDG